MYILIARIMHQKELKGVRILELTNNFDKQDCKDITVFRAWEALNNGTVIQGLKVGENKGEIVGDGAELCHYPRINVETMESFTNNVTIVYKTIGDRYGVVGTSGIIQEVEEARLLRAAVNGENRGISNAIVVEENGKKVIKPDGFAEFNQKMVLKKSSAGVGMGLRVLRGDNSYKMDENGIAYNNPEFSGDTINFGMGVKGIKEKGFVQAGKLVTVSMGDTVIKVGESAFSGCVNLLDLTIGKNVQEIPVNMCKDCIRLKNVSIPVGVKIIRKGAFMNCRALKRVELSKGTKVEPGAFPINCKKVLV